VRLRRFDFTTRLSDRGFALLGPLVVSLVEVYDLIAATSKFGGSLLGTYPTPAVDEDRLVAWNLLLSLTNETPLEYIDIGGTRDMTLGVFVGMTDIEQGGLRLVHEAFVLGRSHREVVYPTTGKQE